MEVVASARDTMPTREGDLTIEGHGIDPIPLAGRYGSLTRVFTVWFSPNLVPAAFAIGTLAAASFIGLGWWAGLAAIVIGNVISAAVVGVLAAMGPRSGMAQIPASRLPFGKTIVAPGVINWLSTIAWDAINAFFGAYAIDVLTGGGDPVPGQPRHRHRLPGRALDRGLRGDPHLREVGRGRPLRALRGGHARGGAQDGLRPGRRVGRVAGHVRADDHDRGQLQPGLGALRVRLHALPAGQRPGVPGVPLDLPRPRAVRHLARGAGPGGHQRAGQLDGRRDPPDQPDRGRRRHRGARDGRDLRRDGRGERDERLHRLAFAARRRRPHLASHVGRGGRRAELRGDAVPVLRQLPERRSRTTCC